jgi:hypothetical protein
MPASGRPAGSTHTPRASSVAAMVPAAAPSGGTGRRGDWLSVRRSGTAPHGCQMPA